MQNHTQSQPIISRMPPGSSRLTANPLILKLESLASLTDADRELLETISADPRSVPAQTDLIRERDAPDGVYLILDGVACRYKLRANGARQIMAFLIPGDFCDLDVALLKEMDHAIGTLSACQVVQIPLQTIQDILRDHPALNRALRLTTLVDEATLREWLVNLGHRSAEERIAHLLSELLLRFQTVERASSDSYAFPLTQADIADSAGLNGVLVSRTLNSLREQGLIEISDQRLRILDLPRLQALAEFRPNYLHLSRETAG